MPPITLKGHLSAGHDGFAPRPSVEGCPRVTVGGVPVHCEGQAWASHSDGTSSHVGYLAQGAPYVTIAGRGVARAGDPITCGDKAAQGCPRVTVGDCGGPEYSLSVLRQNLDDPKDRLLLCLPEIAGAEAGRRIFEQDKQGWLYLREMFFKWFGGRANTDPDANPEPFVVDWDWIMGYVRAADQYVDFTRQPGLWEIKNNIYNSASQRSIGNDLKNDGLLTGGPTGFDYTALPKKDWYGRAFNFRTVPAKPTWDGLQAALAGFTLRALARGYAEPDEAGGHVITVTGCAVFAYDRFAFQNDGDDFYYWNCEKKAFSIMQGQGDVWLEGGDFLNFQKRNGTGDNFIVLSELHQVEDFKEMRYVFA